MWLAIMLRLNSCTHLTDCWTSQGKSVSTCLCFHICICLRLRIHWASRSSRSFSYSSHQGPPTSLSDIWKLDVRDTSQWVGRYEEVLTWSFCHQRCLYTFMDGATMWTWTSNMCQHPIKTGQATHTRESFSYSYLHIYDSWHIYIKYRSI